MVLAAPYSGGGPSRGAKFFSHWHHAFIPPAPLATHEVTDSLEDKLFVYNSKHGYVAPTQITASFRKNTFSKVGGLKGFAADTVLHRLTVAKIIGNTSPRQVSEAERAPDVLSNATLGCLCFKRIPEFTEAEQKAANACLQAFVGLRDQRQPVIQKRAEALQAARTRLKQLATSDQGKTLERNYPLFLETCRSDEELEGARLKVCKANELLSKPPSAWDSEAAAAI